MASDEENNLGSIASFSAAFVSEGRPRWFLSRVPKSPADGILDVRMSYDEKKNLCSVPSWRSTFIWYCVSSNVVFAACGLGLFFTTVSPHIIQMFRATQTVEVVYEHPKGDLFAAAAAGSSQDVSNIPKQGVNPNIRDSKLWTPLHHAVVNGNEETINSLLEYKNTGW